MNPNLKAVLNFLAYAGILAGLALVQYLTVTYPKFDGTLVTTLLIQAGTGLGLFHLTGGAVSTPSQPTGETK